jgi:hypothetical protein
VHDLEYVLLADGRQYREPGAGYYDGPSKDRTIRRAVHLLGRYGYCVTLDTAA